MSQNNLPAVFGADGQPCTACGAPLAGDQRYCLYCGTRRAEARLEFLDSLATATAPLAPAGQLAVGGVLEREEPRGLNGWLRANTPVLALAGLLLGMLFIGLLVGHWATDGGGGSIPASAAAPQVIRVQGGGTSATDAAATDAAVAGGAAAAKKTARKAKAASSSGPTVVRSIPKDAVDVNALNNLSGKAKSKAIDDAVKKGKPISTGTGKLPPKDNKPAGGGSDFETIG